MTLRRTLKKRGSDTYINKRNRALGDIIAELESSPRLFGLLCTMLHDVRKQFNIPAPHGVIERDSFMDKGTRYNLISMNKIRPPNSFNQYIIRHKSYVSFPSLTRALHGNSLTYYDLALYFYDTYKVYDRLDAAHRQVHDILHSLGRTIEFEESEEPSILTEDRKNELILNLERVLRYIIAVENIDDSRLLNQNQSLLDKVLNNSTRKGGRRRMRKQKRKTMRKKKRSKRS